MTVAEAAKKIGISASKLYQLVTARKIAHYRVGGKIIFGDEDIAAFLANCRVGAAPLNVTMPPRQVRLKHISLT